MIPTPEQFVASTSIKGAKKTRGSTLLRIEAALGAWLLKKDMGSKHAIQVLYTIMKECERYLAKHANQKNYRRHKSRKNEYLLYARIAQVESLLKEGRREIEAMMPGLVRGFDIMRERKRRHLEDERTLMPRPLQGNYQMERKLYVEGLGKQSSPISGSFVHDVLSNGSQVSDQFFDSPQGQEIFRARIDDRGIPMSLDFWELSPSQYLTLGYEGGGNVVGFFDKMARAKFLAIPDGAGGFNDINERPINMTVHNDVMTKLHMYVLDHHGNLLTRVSPRNSQRGGNQGVEYFNHSSFNAGREVTCAGMIWIAGGKLLHIDNNSGHYAPTTQHLTDALAFLSEEGIDLSRTRVADHDPNGPLHGRQCHAMPFIDGICEIYTEQQAVANGLPT